MCSYRKLCDKDDCGDCLNKSFASSDKAQFWSDKNTPTPRQVFKGSDKKCWFNCDCGHEFNSVLGNITSQNYWCPLCKNKTEKKLLHHFKITHETIQHQYKPNWCKNPETNRHLPYDFVIKKLKLIIELDGEQHFSQVSNWGSPKKTQKRDLYKMKCANENGYTVIRLLQEDVFNDKGNWDEELDNALTATYNEPTRIFIGNEEKYGCYEEDEVEDEVEVNNE